MQARTMAIIGAGISGLTLALELQRLPSLKIHIFERAANNGGRIESSPLSNDTYADMGANYFDFQHAQQQAHVRQFMDSIGKQKFSKHLEQFKQPFLIFEKEQLRKSDIYKPRYYYKNGFRSFLNDVNQTLNKQCCIINNYTVKMIKRMDHKWMLVDNSNNQYPDTYDFIVLACSGMDSASLLQNSEIEGLTSLYQRINSIKYTRQISAVFELKQKSPFSSILFKNQAISFISSHEEKYQSNTHSVAVIQMSQKFSESNYGKSEKQIGELIKKQLPVILNEYIGECLKVKFWYPSLIKNRNIGMIDTFQRPQQCIFVTGDVVYGSSRVTGAMEVSLKLSEIIKKNLSMSSL